MPKTIEEVQSELEAVQAELSGAKDRIKELNGEAQGRRNDLKTATKRVEELQAQLETVTTERDNAATTHAAEIERQRIELTAQSRDAEARANETIAAYKGKQTDLSLNSVAARLGMSDMDGLKLLDRSTFKVSEDGTVENAEEVLTAFKEAKPYFFGTAARPGTHTGTTTTSTNPPRANPPGAFDARSAKAEDVNAQAKSLGITTVNFK